MQVDFGILITKYFEVFVKRFRENVSFLNKKEKNLGTLILAEFQQSCYCCMHLEKKLN